MQGKTEKNEAHGWKRVIFIIYILLGILYFPVLFCMIFIGNHMNYNELLKQGALLPNFVLLLISIFWGGYAVWAGLVFQETGVNKKDKLRV